MKPITNFREMLSSLHGESRKPRVVAVCPTDQATRYALDKAQAEELCTYISIDGEPQEASQRAVETVKRGEGDVIMKGHLNTDVLLRALLDKQKGLMEPGNVLTHIATVEIPAYNKLLFLTDVAVIPYPTSEQRKVQLRYLVDFCRSFGIEEPKVALLHCSEKTDLKHFPFLSQYTELKAIAAAGGLGPCIVDGPMDVRSACSREAMLAKDQHSAIDGKADALIFPDIEAGNLFYKTVSLFAGARTAGVLHGTRVPVVASSRADSGEAKFLSLCVALKALAKG